MKKPIKRNVFGEQGMRNSEARVERRDRIRPKRSPVGDRRDGVVQDSCIDTELGRVVGHVPRSDKLINTLPTYNSIGIHDKLLEQTRPPHKSCQETLPDLRTPMISANSANQSRPKDQHVGFELDIQSYGYTRIRNTYFTLAPGVQLCHGKDTMYSP